MLVKQDGNVQEAGKTKVKGTVMIYQECVWRMASGRSCSKIRMLGRKEQGQTHIIDLWC